MEQSQTSQTKYDLETALKIAGLVTFSRESEKLYCGLTEKN